MKPFVACLAIVKNRTTLRFLCDSLAQGQLKTESLCAFYVGFFKPKAKLKPIFSIQCGTTLPWRIGFSLILQLLTELKIFLSFFIKQPKYSCTLNSAIGLLWNSCQSRRISIKMPLVAESTFIVKRFPSIMPLSAPSIDTLWNFSFHMPCCFHPLFQYTHFIFQVIRPMAPFLQHFESGNLIIITLSLYYFPVSYFSMCIFFLEWLILFYFIFAS